MRQKWKAVYEQLTPILRKAGIITNQTTIIKVDGSFYFETKEEISFENAVEILHLLEEKFKVSSFDFEDEYDDWYDENPNVCFGIYSYR